MSRTTPIAYSSFPRKRVSRQPSLKRWPWTPAFAGVICVSLGRNTCRSRLVTVSRAVVFPDQLLRSLRGAHRQDFLRWPPGHLLHMVKVVAETADPHSQRAQLDD